MTKKERKMKKTKQCGLAALALVAAGCATNGPKFNGPKPGETWYV